MEPAFILSYLLFTRNEQTAGILSISRLMKFINDDISTSARQSCSLKTDDLAMQKECQLIKFHRLHYLQDFKERDKGKPRPCWMDNRNEASAMYDDDGNIQ